MTRKYIDHDSKIQTFFRWLEAHDCDFSLLEVRTVNGLRGLYARRDIPAEERVLRVPRQIILSSEVAKGSPIGQHLQAHEVQLSTTAWLSVFIAMDRRQPHSFWRAYYDVLPTDYSDLPINFTSEEFEYLRGTSIEEDVKAMKESWLDEHNRINACLNGAEQITYPEYAWARAVTMTRCHRAEMNGVNAQAIVPGACMMNHGFNTKSRWPYAPNMSMAFFKKANRDIAANEEILENYGDKSTSQFLKNYGVYIENNPHDVTDLFLALPDDAHPFREEAMKLGYKNYSGRGFELPLQYNNASGKKLFSYLRLVNSDDIPSVQQALKAGADAAALPPVSQKNELAAMRMLADACERRLKRFETSLEEDEHILKTENLPYKLRAAVNVRVSEKRVLQRTLHLTQAAIPLLIINSSLLFKSIATHCKPDGQFAPYFKELMKGLYPKEAGSMPELQQDAA